MACLWEITSFSNCRRELLLEFGIFRSVDIRRRITPDIGTFTDWMCLLEAADSLTLVIIRLFRESDGISCSYFNTLSTSLQSMRLDRGLQLAIF
jgi:hypothetical protein